jgi:hypothetical protein
MKRTPSDVAGTSSTISTTRARPGRRTVFAAVMDALHHSRRLQAERVFREYDHLVHRPARPILTDRIPADSNNQRPHKDTLRRTPANRPLVLIEKALIAALLIVFIMLHVLADSALRRAEAERAASEWDPSSLLLD